MGVGKSREQKGTTSEFRTAQQHMKSTYVGGTVKPLKDWHKWSSDLEWSIPKEGTFEVWIWEKFVREFHSRLQTHGSLEKANLWLQESTKLQQQGIQKSQTVRSNINRSSQQPLLICLHHHSHIRNPQKMPLTKRITAALVTLCEARGISIIEKSKLECIEALERDDFQQGPEGGLQALRGGGQGILVVSPFQFMTAIQGPDEDASVYWQRLKQGVTDAGFEPGPDAPENTQPVSPIHLMLKAKFLAGLVPKLRDRLMVARPEAHYMSFHSLMATIQAIELDLHARKEAKSAKIMAALELIAQDHHRYPRKNKLTKRTNMTCFNCSQKAHLARHCPENEDKKEQNSPSPYKFVPDRPPAHNPNPGKSYRSTEGPLGTYHFIPDPETVKTIGAATQSHSFAH
ncbi:hypothetical protein XELAEV_18002950mg [Xenopus laevis]|nr:hypothetical protein XELAEV_18002950mg [Xenopus laevis]